MPTGKVEKKILVKVWKPLIELLNVKTKQACLKRDAFLDRALCEEAHNLKSDIGQINSPEATKHIFESLKNVEPVSVSLVLSLETINALNRVCKDLGIPRDAFVNRVFFLLVAPKKLIKQLFFRWPEPEQYGSPDDNYKAGEKGLFDHDDPQYYTSKVLKPNPIDSIYAITSNYIFGFLRDVLKHGGANKDKLHSYKIAPNDLQFDSASGLDVFNVWDASFLNCVISEEDLKEIGALKPEMEETDYEKIISQWDK